MSQDWVLGGDATQMDPAERAEALRPEGPHLLFYIYIYFLLYNIVLSTTQPLKRDTDISRSILSVPFPVEPSLAPIKYFLSFQLGN